MQETETFSAFAENVRKFRKVCKQNVEENIEKDLLGDDVPTWSLTVRPWKVTESQKESIIFFAIMAFRGELLNFWIVVETELTPCFPRNSISYVEGD